MHMGWLVVVASRCNRRYVDKLKRMKNYECGDGRELGVVVAFHAKIGQTTWPDNVLKNVELINGAQFRFDDTLYPMW